MYRIGICDNAESVCVSLKEMILQFAHANHVQMETMIWHTGEELYIVLFEMSGIEAGDYIRNYLDNKQVQIVYISENSSYALELFQTQPLNFLIKPIVQE